MFSIFILIGAAACLVSLAVNWGAREAARRLGLVDRPDGHRKLQTHAIPLAGGIAIFATALIIIGALAAFSPPWRKTLFDHEREVLGISISSLIIVVLGIIDDFVGLRGRQKFLGQLVAAYVLVSFDIVIDRIHILGLTFNLNWMSVPFTMFWLVGAINALNLMDGIDGLAATLGVILSGAISVAAMLSGHNAIALFAVVLAGSLAGFLRYNLPPASMYLGDAGSMLIGLAVGVMAIMASLKTPGTVLLGFPLALWTIPIFDSTAAILRRKLTGRSIYTTDRAHMHHHLMSRLGHHRTLTCMGSVAFLTSGAALLGVIWKNDSISLICAIGVVVMFVVLKVFGHAEFALLIVKLRSFARSLFHSRAARSGITWDDSVHMQGTRQWGLIWESLTDCAKRLGFVRIQLDVNVPTLGEGYHAAWNRPNVADLGQQWRLELPLMIESRVLGFVKVVGDRNQESGRHIEDLLEVLGDVERHLKLLSRPDAASGAVEARAAVDVNFSPEPTMKLDPR